MKVQIARNACGRAKSLQNKRLVGNDWLKVNDNARYKTMKISSAVALWQLLSDAQNQTF